MKQKLIIGLLKEGLKHNSSCLREKAYEILKELEAEPIEEKESHPQIEEIDELPVGLIPNGDTSLRIMAYYITNNRKTINTLIRAVNALSK